MTHPRMHDATDKESLASSAAAYSSNFGSEIRDPLVQFSAFAQSVSTFDDRVQTVTEAVIELPALSQSRQEPLLPLDPLRDPMRYLGLYL